MLNQDFKEFIQLLNDNEVRYLVIGGYALAVHGCPRYTKDLDVWLDVSEGNAARTINALKDFGFESLGISLSDLADKQQVIQIGYPPSRIDLVTSADGVDFDTCYSSRLTVDIDGASVNFIDVENLKANKRATGRTQDLADVEALQGL